MSKRYREEECLREKMPDNSAVIPDTLLRPALNKMPASRCETDHAPGLGRPCIRLTDARCGERLRVVSVERDCATSARLRELGFCESAEICKVLAQRGMCICLLAGTRVALGPDLAAHVLVEPVR